MRFKIVLMCVAISLRISAQEVIAAQGDRYSNAVISIDWTIGETLIETISDSSVHLTQGFHQPLLVVTSLEGTDKELSIDIFPNPAADLIWVRLEKPVDGLRFELYDPAGKILENGEVRQTQQPILLGAYPAGTYYLLLTSELHNKPETYKIQKAR